MRAIINLWGRASSEAGWKAREVELEGSGATIEDVLRTAELRDGRSLFDLIGEDGGIKAGYAIQKRRPFSYHGIPLQAGRLAVLEDRPTFWGLGDGKAKGQVLDLRQAVLD